MMSIGFAKADAVEKDLEVKETNGNDEKDEDAEKGSDEDELDDDEFEVDCILNVAAIDGEVKYQVRWKGYGSDEDSWEPEWNLETARLILDEYIANHQDEVKKAQYAATRKNLRKRRGKETTLQNKRRRKLRRSSSLAYSEATKTLNVRNRKKTVLEKLEFEDDHNSNDSDDEDHEEISKKRESRYRATNNKRKTSKNSEIKSPLKNLLLKKPKNAWLYDESEDTDSHTSESNERTKKDESNMSCETDTKLCENDLDKEIVDGREPEGRESFQKVDVSEKNYEPKVEFIGVVQCNDGVIKVIYTRKDERWPHVVSVKEAYEIDGFGLVQYFISRCEFGEPQISNS